MSKALIFLLLGIILLNSCMAFLPYLSAQAINPAASGYNPCADIRNGQFVCLDCSTLAFCLQEGGNWVTWEYENCRTDKSMFCDEEAKGCTIQRECLVPSRGIKFECQNPGTYPDPYDCKLYHSCNNFNEDTRYVCPSGTAYSVADKDCTLNAAKSDTCRQAQYNCDKVGTMGTWPDDENIYYVCHVKPFEGKLVLYPLLYRCQEGKVFDGQQCISDFSVNKSSTSYNPNQIDNTSQEGCTEGKLLPHLNDCHAYYSCTKGTLVARQCPQGSYFNQKGALCDFGNC